MGLDIDNTKIIAEGDFDFRGTLGVEKTVPVGFQEIRMTFLINSHEPEDKLSKLIQLIERYCVIYQTLKNGVKISINTKIN